MKQNITNYFLIGWMIIATTSCKKEITYILPTSERRIVVNSLFSSEQLMKVQVYSSKFITDNYYTPLFLNNATVSVYGNGSLIEVLPRTADGVYESSFTYPQTGINYSLLVSVPEMGTATTQGILLDPVSVLGFDSVGISTDEWGMQTVKAKIKIKDNPDTDNFYRLSLMYCYYNYYYDEFGNYILNDIPYFDKIYFSTNDPVLEAESEMGYFFSDALINGKEYELSIMLDEYLFSPWVKYFYAVVEHISPDYYKYGVSLPAHFEAEDMSIFMEAVIVHNNIENGIGIFGTSVSSSDTLFNNNFGKFNYKK